jgi:hypothetical protein
VEYIRSPTSNAHLNYLLHYLPILPCSLDKQLISILPRRVHNYFEAHSLGFLIQGRPESHYSQKVFAFHVSFALSFETSLRPRT